MFESIDKVLLITDMDGTFLPSSKIPGEKSLKAIKDFENRGGKFSIATGRAFQAALQYFETVTVNCPIILCNGGMVYDLNNRRQLYDVFLPDNSDEIIADILKNNAEVGCEILTLENVFVPRLNESEKRHIGICKVNPVYIPLEEIPQKRYKALFAAEPEITDRLEEYVENKGWNNVDFVRSTPEYYEILPKNITKGSALKKMREICNMEDYTIIAAGDYNNDIEMLEQADIGICPANASDDVKRIADIVLDITCEQDVIAKIIDFIYDKFK